eukprot:EG_transcript_34717
MSHRTLKLLLAGDVMLARGIDAILEHSVNPALHEGCVKDARVYVQLAERAHGPLPPPHVRWAQPGAYVWGSALPALDSEAPDARIVNLETALTTAEDWQRWKGIHYRCHPVNAAAVLRAGKVDVAILANNHAGDWGLQGMQETLQTLLACGVVPVGIGKNHSEAYDAKVVRGGVVCLAV